MRVIMGPCRWKHCSCPQGDCITDSSGQAETCNECAHPLAYHEEYTVSEPTLIPVLKKDPPAQVTKIPSEYLYDAIYSKTNLIFIVTPSPIAERTGLITEIFRRLEDSAIVRISGTPASGKTTLMRLMMKSLMIDPKNTQHIYALYSWIPAKVENMGGFQKYLNEMTGKDADEWLGYPAYLFIDEAQTSYEDTDLWSYLFKSVTPKSKCRIVLFTSYGSPDEGAEGFFQLKSPETTQMTFGKAQQISLRPDLTVIPDHKPVGMLLDETESMKLAEDLINYRSSSHFTGGVSEDFKYGVWKISQATWD
ncbi:uncharacterized protein BO97DRAFT_147755 [Aspergillus homomorphus CBS 101889]|uniref:Uncharacterized protein n=1 Tax=Aspergillus homomorphus (strain CBS 101889) TaxID=1450537 RepID=A0A395HR62_ASPHC|nr:hypothetical protein BO97DRAFT_147755 [Aspergillus homomorphus CBS 101889]RAL10076.1 hypothetical protein BO97DRAFT_147755 [Aspergillus homomorphus CBS 101889]